MYKKIMVIIFTVGFFLLDMVIGWSMIWVWSKLFGSGVIYQILFLITFLITSKYMWGQVSWGIEKWKHLKKN